MACMPDSTHDGALRSWVESANEGNTDFPVQNLPFGVFRPKGEARPRVGVAIGDSVLDLAVTAEAGLLSPAMGAEVGEAAGQSSLNALMSLGAATRRRLRAVLSRLLQHDTDEGRTAVALRDRLLHPSDQVELLLPVQVGDYTDFYASVHHATNIGTMLRPDSPLLPNYKWIPIGYHGRASSVVVSGTAVRRPWGQTRADGAAPVYAPSARIDYEAEVGFFVGDGNALGVPVGIGEAGDHLFGVTLLNDWSARDVQAWEYQPLGPFLSKNFASTVSPWVVTMEALAPYRTAAYARPAGDPAALPYLTSASDQQTGAFDLTIEVLLRSVRMRAERMDPVRVSRGNTASLYWTPAQMLTHHASGGCNLRPGDLLGSGTVSGPARESRGCLMELTWRGAEPITLPTGETRRFLEDGDEVIMRGYAERNGYRRIGLGECVGQLWPALGAP